MKLISIADEHTQFEKVVVVSQVTGTILGVFPISGEHISYGDGHALEKSAGILVDSL